MIFTSVNSSSSAYLVCYVSSTTVVSGVSWQRTVGSTVTGITTMNNNGGSTPILTLTIENADSYNAGIYQCFVSNNAGRDQSASLSVTSNSK